MGYEIGRIGIEAQIENAPGVDQRNAIATASPRVETIIFGPADFMASINMKSLVVGEQPPGYEVGDAYHHILMSSGAARAHMTRGHRRPYLQIKDVDASSGWPAGRPRSASTANGCCTGSDRRGQRDVLAVAERLRPAETSSTPTSTPPPKPAGSAASDDDRRRDDDEASRKMALVIR